MQDCANWRRAARATRCAAHYYRHHAAVNPSGSPSPSLLSDSCSQPSSSSNAEPPIPRQRRVSAYMDRAFQAAEQHAAEDYLVQLKIRHGLSYSSLSGEYMRKFAQSLRPDFRLPCKATLQKRASELYGRVKADVEDKLQAVKLVALAADAWEDAAHGEIFATTATPLVGRRKPLLLNFRRISKRMTAQVRF